MANRNLRFALAAIALTFMFVAMPGSARAATIMVTTLADPAGAAGTCSLREAITNANGQSQSGSTNCTAGTGTDTIVFQPGLTGTITLGSTLPAIANALTITGTTNTPGITIDGGGTVQLMQVNSGATLNLQLLTLENGSATGASGSVGMVGEGGGVFNSGALAITNSTLSGNHATGGNSTAVSARGGDGVGGGIFNSGTLTITDSTFSANTATGGGFGGSGGASGNGNGGAIGNNGTVTVTNSTFSGNQANGGSIGFGGAILNGYSIYAMLFVINCTFAVNQATFGGGGAIDNRSGTAGFEASVLADRTTGGNCDGFITDDGYNISDDSSCGFTSTGNAVNGDGIDPMLAGGLANNGGPTQTIALGSDSDAVALIPFCTDANGDQLTTDQRGFPRPAPGQTQCCSGAYEFGDPTATATATATATPTSTATATATPTATATATATSTATPTATPTPSGEGSKQLVVSPSPPSKLNFGTVSVGTTSASQTATITSEFNDDTVDFFGTFILANFVETGSTCGATLGPLAACQVDFACKPKTTGSLIGAYAFLYSSGESGIMDRDDYLKIGVVQFTCTGG